METFFSFLEKRVDDCSSLLCVGLDPHIPNLREPTAASALDFCLNLVKATAPYAAAFKPNATFFEVFGADGWKVLKQVIDTIHGESERLGSKIPTILDAKVATATIPSGAKITVDAYSGRVYEGEVPELLRLQVTRQSSLKETPVYQALAHIAELTVPLHLIDPKSPDFIPENCRTLHDIMRLVHELSYQHMFQISDQVSDVRGCSVSLSAPIPLYLCIIDLGGGLNETREGVRRVTVEKVVSAPFKALLKGMLHEGVRYMNPRPVELKGFFSVMSEQMLAPGPGGERFGDRSYAIISDKYLNLSSRVGYHYAILDSYCGQTINNNYITFSFKGGAADDIRRNRRARSIGRILEELGFVVEVTGDRVNARFQKYECAVIAEKLDLMGRLLQFTRQMDMLMRSEAAVETIANAFLQGNYNLE